MGLVNWDYRRQQRDSDFRAEGRIVLVAEVVSLIATATAAILLRDFTAILYGLIGRAAMTVICRTPSRGSVTPPAMPVNMRRALHASPGDRKSVVSGKSVSGRVDLGGRRF